MRWKQRRLGVAAVALAALVPLAAIGTAGAASDGPSHSGQHVPRLDHVFVIMLENHSRSSVIDDVNAPFITGLAHRFGMADQYFGVTHPSMPNYVATLAGDNFGIQDDNDQNVVNLDRPNLVDQLETHGRSWGAYMQTLPDNKTDRFGPTLPDGTVVQLYARKHNPFVLFDDIASNPARMSHVRDYSALAADLDSAHAPDLVWITPNQCSDMHGGVNVAVPGHPETPCPFGSTKDDPNDAALKRKADAFVHGAVDTITGSRSWTGNSAIFIVTDDNDFTGNEQTRRLGERGRLLRLTVRLEGRCPDQRRLAWWHLRRRAHPGRGGDHARPARVVQPHPVQPLLAAADDRGQLAAWPPRPRR